MAVAAVVVDRPQRWDEPFGEDPLTDAEIERVLSMAPFREIDEGAFTPAAPLRGILANDTRIVRYRAGDVVFRQGDHGTSAFFVLSGAMRVVLDGDVAERIRGGGHHERRGFLGTLAQLWRNSSIPEARDPRGEGEDARVLARGIFLQDVPAVISDRRTARLEEGHFFGEISALERTARTATIFAETDACLLELRWQGLRDISRRAPELQRNIDALYRQNALQHALLASPLFGHLSPDDLRVVAESTTFETYGEYDWPAQYKRLARKGTAEKLRSEPVIAEEGHYPNGLILLRSGFGRVSRRLGNGHVTLRYLGAGQIFGLEEIVENWRRPSEPLPYQTTLRAVGYVNALMIPTHVLEDVVLPTLPEEELPGPRRPARDEARSGVRDASSEIRTEYLEELVERRFINGTATMMIDLDRCTRCDDCVRACASTHDGNPRFVRHGVQIGRFMIANACMHCADPVCMIGCPTGAIHREPEGQVSINDDTCIGCATCANSCPYHNIRMVEVRDRSGALMIDDETHTPILKATKCDLCLDQTVAPACQNACPHDALKRVDLQGGDRSTLLELLKR